MRDLFDVEKNREYLEQLKENRKNLVPFLGAGFSADFCPTWDNFLKDYFQSMKANDDLLPEEIKEFEKLQAASRPNRLEVTADFLVEKSAKQGFKEEMKRQMDVKVPIEKVKKFHLLHAAFPFLKITTNYDCLIESTVPQGIHVEVAYGDEKEKLHRLFTLRHELDCLLKIHGSINDMNSIVLSSQQYQNLYGHAHRYNADADLPVFLKRVFQDSSVLFIGCSLETDRTAMIMADLPDMPRHFALMKLPETGREKTLLKRRLRNLGICTIWLEDYHQIEEILAYLADKPVGAGVSLPRWGLFVGREKELDTIAANIDKGGIQTITGRLYSIDGAGGVGKTALAIEAAQRYKDKFKHGVLPLFRADEHSPASFAMALAGHLQIKIAEPPDNEAALQAVTALLQNRQCLLILDNVEKWEDLQYMIPLRTSAAILVTTRNRDIHHKIRNHFPGLRVEEIPLEKFTTAEALALFQRMLGKEYREQDKDIYLEIAGSLGFLPIALRQAVSLMVYTPHYRAKELRDKLSTESRLDLLRRGCAETESDSRVIEAVFDLSAPLLTKELQDTLALLAVCSPGPVPLDFLQRVAKDKNINEESEQLHTYSWCDRRERDGDRFYELHQLVRELVRERGELQYSGAFIQEVHDIFTDDALHFSLKERYYFQLEEAFAAAVREKDPRLKKWLYRLYYFCTYRGYAHFYLRLTQEVERIFPGDQWKIKDMYCFRALILQGFGKLEEAMIFHRKYEKKCEELGDRAGLSGCYGNQALILKAWGQLEEAMKLHKKEEAICEELGNRSELAICWWNQGLIYMEKGDPHTQAQLWQKSIDTDQSMGIPTEKYEKDLKKLLKKLKKKK